MRTRSISATAGSLDLLELLPADRRPTKSRSQTVVYGHATPVEPSSIPMTLSGESMMQRRSRCRAMLLMPALLLASCGQGVPADLPAPSPADPLAARSHLPMPWRIIGASFVSLEKGEAGWATGLMADGYYLVDFDEAGLVWRHADLEDHYPCTPGNGRRL